MGGCDVIPFYVLLYVFGFSIFFDFIYLFIHLFLEEGGSRRFHGTVHWMFIFIFQYLLDYWTAGRLDFLISLSQSIVFVGYFLGSFFFLCRSFLTIFFPYPSRFGDLLDCRLHGLCPLCCGPVFC